MEIVNPEDFFRRVGSPDTWTRMFCLACGDPVTTKSNSPFCDPCAQAHVAGLNADNQDSEDEELERLVEIGMEVFDRVMDGTWTPNLPPEEDDDHPCDQCGEPTGTFPIVSNLCEDCLMYLSDGAVEDAATVCRCERCGYEWETNTVYDCPGCGSNNVARS